MCHFDSKNLYSLFYFNHSKLVILIMVILAIEYTKYSQY